ncbi:MAG: (2E,6E)-farnesyl diphosphate synthase [Thiotrichales bacterium]|nr:MAG: (2E,6E)-farnesyl diphosphate synthase [Thiotrichales bacterium]
MSDSTDFHTRLKHYQSRVDKALESCLPPAHSDNHQLAEAMRYSVIGGGGKRIRPAMVYAAGTSLGVDEAILDIPACAVEMMHTYSLIHDDLPAMDDDDLRRGQPTCHKKFDEATAILAGDALQAHAFEILASSELEHRRQLEMITLLAAASGADGMAGGQAMDLAAVGVKLSLEQLESMHRLKTGALIKASILLGAMCSTTVTGDELGLLGRYADCIGLSFQIQDDILDVVGDTETLGKPRGSDQKMQKPTYPSILGLDASRQLAMEQHQQALSHLEALDARADTLRQLSAYIVERRF